MFFELYEKLCKEKGLTPTGASIAIGFSKGTVSYWRKKYTEGVDIKPDSKTAERIADFFGVSVDYLLGRSDAPVDSVLVVESSGSMNGRPVSDEDIKFALFGGSGEITDAMYEEVKRFAAYIKQQHETGKKE